MRGFACAALGLAASCVTTTSEPLPDAVGVIVLTDVHETRGAFLAARPFKAVDMTDAHLLLTSSNLIDMLDLAAPEDWPAAAREAWASGAAACRDKAVRPPYRESEEARACTDALGASMVHRLARARGASLLVTIDADAPPMEGMDPIRIVASTPSANDTRILIGARKDAGALVDEVWRGGGQPMFSNQPSLPQPAHAQDDVTGTGGFRPFDVVAVAGCVRPLPSALEVSPRDVAMSKMIEHAWSTMSPSLRTAPPTRCTLRAVEVWQGSSKALEGSLACEGLPVGKKILLRTGSRANDVANLAKELVDRVAFDGCKYR